MRLIIASLALLALGGCQTKQIEEMSYSERKALASDIQKRCYAQGVKPGSSEYEACARVEIQREDYTRRNAPRLEFNPQGAAVALQGVSQGYYRAAAQNQASTSVTCTSAPAPAGHVSYRCN